VPARTDLATDPQVLLDLAQVRLGTASFRRALSHVTDAGFDEPSALPGWTRRHLVAHVGYNARALSRLVVWADTGVETPMYASPEDRAREIELGATLGPQALRSLADQSAIELDVRWRDLAPERWAQLVVTGQGREVPASETLWLRAREVWLHGVDLRTGLLVPDIPELVLRRLLADVVGLWQRRGEADGWVLQEQGGSAQRWAVGTLGGLEVRGTLAAMVAWATGRGATGVTFSDDVPRPAPRWI
jgi:maleylpyruvate isomerase